MAHYELKIKEEFMNAKQDGEKPFEIRYNDRGFQKGDTVSFVSDNSYKTAYAGKYEITYVTAFVQKYGWVVFGDRLVSANY